MRKATLFFCLSFIFTPGTWAQGINCNIDLCFVVDSSGSIGKENWNLVLDFVASVAEEFTISPIETQVAVVRFGYECYLDIPLNRFSSDKEKLKSAIRDLRFEDSSTGTPCALKLTREGCFSRDNGARPGYIDVAVLVTDGQPTIPLAGGDPDTLRAEDDTVDQARLLKDTGSFLYTVGVGDLYDASFLMLLSSDNKVIAAPDFDQLTSEMVSRLQQAVCSSVPVTPPPVSLPLPPVRCTNPMTRDIVVAIDGSGSVGSQNFRSMVEFARQIVLSQNIDDGTVRVGLTLFSDISYTQFQLSQGTTRNFINARFQILPYPPGSGPGKTNTPSMLNAIKDMFTINNGDRIQAMNVLVILTDGGSTNSATASIVAAELRRQGVLVYVIGVGTWMNKYELYHLGSFPKDQYVNFINSFQELNNVQGQFIADLCGSDQCQNPSVCSNGGVCQPYLLNYQCQCPNPFVGPSCQQSCEVPQIDLGFAIDVSSSLKPDDHQAIFLFVYNIIKYLRVDDPFSNGPRISICMFNDDPDLKCSMDLQTIRQVQDTFKQKFFDSINTYQYGGGTDFAMLFRNVMSTMFTSQLGDRPQVPNYLLIFTDGRSANRSGSFIEASRARDAGIETIVVALDGQYSNYDIEELRDMASDPADSHVILTSPVDLTEAKAMDIADSLCRNKGYCSSSPCVNGRCSDRVLGYTCTCDNGFTGKNCDIPQEPGSGGTELVFAVDTSGSIPPGRFVNIQKFLHDIVERTDVSPENTRIAVVSFSNSATVELKLSSTMDKATVKQALFHIKYMAQRTNIAAALSLIRTVVFAEAREGASKCVILVTDGASTMQQENTVPEAVQLRLDGAHIAVVAIGDLNDVAEIRNIASPPTRDTIIFYNSTRQLVDDKDKFMRALRVPYDDTNQCLSSPCRNGGTCNNLWRTYFCQCPFGVTGRTCGRGCRLQIDLALVVDSSGSVDTIFPRIMTFLDEMVYGLDIDSDLVRVSVFTFGEVFKVVSTLNNYINFKAGVLNALPFMPLYGRTDIAMALQQTANTFTASNGDRDGVVNMILLLTDGYSTMNSANVLGVGDSLKANRFKIMVVGTGDNPNTADLMQLASAPATTSYYTMSRATDPMELANIILDDLCTP